MTAHEVDRQIDDVAGRQHGAFSFAQLLAAGGSGDVAAARISERRWRRVTPAVYALASHPPSWHQQLMAAVLGEPTAVVSGPSAAALHSLDGFRPGSRIEVVVPRGSNHRSDLAVVRERKDFERTQMMGIPVLSLRDTLFSAAASAHGSRVAMAMDDALVRGDLTIGELQQRYEELRGGRRRGMATMRALIAVRSAQSYVPPTKALEGLLYRVMDRPGMPSYVRQARVPWSPDQVVDALVVAAKLIIEGDGRRWHTRIADFERDRRRDRAAAEHGYRTLRFTYEELAGEPDRVEAEVRSAARIVA